MKKLILILLLLTSFYSISTGENAQRYAVIKLTKTVNPIMAEHIVDSLKKARNDKVAFIIIQMDTPGGMLQATRDIIKAIMNTEKNDIPVVVYTYPRGAQAASAGGFIMLSAHVAAMAPGTEIGAMHPVSPQLNFSKKDKKGKPSGVMEKKVLNDTMAYGRSLAQKRNRNVKWVENAIKNAISSSYKEALAVGIIDFIADDMDDLITKLNNRKVKINGKIKILKTQGLIAKEYNMNWKQSFLNYFAQPQIVMLLLLIAIVGIGIEFKSPGMIFPAAIGGVALILFLMAVSILPINIVGVLLIVLSIVLFILELYFTSYGFLTLGGIVSFIIGSMIFIDTPLQGGGIPLPYIIGTVIVLLAFIFIVVRAVIKVHKTKIVTGREGLVGETGVAFKDFSGKGKVMIHGEIWNALSDEELKKDDPIVVIEAQGMVVTVKKHTS